MEMEKMKEENRLAGREQLFTEQENVGNGD